MLDNPFTVCYNNGRYEDNMRTWRNWQTRRFQVPVGDHMGSSPFVRTNDSTLLRVLFFVARAKERREPIGSREEGESPTTLWREYSLTRNGRYPSSAP